VCAASHHLRAAQHRLVIDEFRLFLLVLTESQSHKEIRTAPRFVTLTVRASVKGGAHGSFKVEP
jgi:hypothetical protein